MASILVAQRRARTLTKVIARPRPAAAAHPAPTATNPADLHRLSHHGDVDNFAGAIDFAVNVRHTTPPDWLRERLIAAVDELGAYPSQQRTAQVRELIAAHHGVSVEAVLLLAGASEGFTLLAAHTAAHLPGTALLLAPSYTEPEAALRRVGVPVRHVVLPAPYILSSAQLPVLDDVSIAICGNPTNPTGVLHPADAVAALQPSDGILAVDEAFMDLACASELPAPGIDMQAGEPQSLAGEVVPRRIVLRSLTKTWALAGLRLGYAVGDPELLAQLDANRPPWHIGTLQLAAFEAVFSPCGIAALAEERRRLVVERDTMLGLLGAAGIETAADSAAPFVLVRMPKQVDPARFRTQLAAAGIAVRRCDTFPGLDWAAGTDDSARPSEIVRNRHHLRLAVRPQAQVEQLIQAWTQAQQES